MDKTGAIAGLIHRIMVSRSQAEVGLIVRSDLKRRGMGDFLLRRMLGRSATQGFKTLSASVLWENRAALRLAAKIGYIRQEVSSMRPLTTELMFELGRTKLKMIDPGCLTVGNLQGGSQH